MSGHEGKRSNLHRRARCYAAIAAALWGASMLPGCSNRPANDSGEESAVGAPAASDTSAEAVEVADRMLAKYRRADAYTDHATYVEQAVYRGEGVERELPFFEMSVAFSRPNRLRLTLDEALPASTGKRGIDVACDGTKFRARLRQAPAEVLEMPAPSQLTSQNLLPDPQLRAMIGNQQLSNVFPQAAMFLCRDEDELIFPQDDHPRLLEDATLRGRRCRRVATSSPDGPRVLWIDAQTYALHRMELPADSHRQRYSDTDMFLKLSVRIDFRDMTFDEVVDDQSFAFDAGEAKAVVALSAPGPAGEKEGEEKATADETKVDETKADETKVDDAESSSNAAAAAEESPAAAPVQDAAEAIDAGSAEDDAEVNSKKEPAEKSPPIAEPPPATEQPDETKDA